MSKIISIARALQTPMGVRILDYIEDHPEIQHKALVEQFGDRAIVCYYIRRLYQSSLISKDHAPYNGASYIYKITPEGNRILGLIKATIKDMKNIE